MDYIFDSQYEVFMFDALQEAGIVFEIHKKVTASMGQDYIFDFVVYGRYAKIVVECDGEQHTFDAHIGHDAVRSLWALLHGGYDDILRFTNYQISHFINDCVLSISERIDELDTILQYTKKPLDLNLISTHKNRDSEIPYRPYKNLSPIITAIPETESEKPEHEHTDPFKKKLSNNDYIMLTKLRNLTIDDKKLLWWIIKRANTNGFLIIHDSLIAKDSELLNIKSLKIMYHIDDQYSTLVLPNNLRLLKLLKPKN